MQLPILFGHSKVPAEETCLPLWKGYIFYGLFCQERLQFLIEKNLFCFLMYHSSYYTIELGSDRRQTESCSLFLHSEPTERHLAIAATAKKV